MTSEDALPRDVESAIRYYADDVRDRLARKLPINTNNALLEELRSIAVGHNVMVTLVHERFIADLRIELEPDVVARLLSAELQAMTA